MSNLTEIRQAYDLLTELLDQQIRVRRGDAAELRRFRKWLDTAFYLLGWANFEYLTRKKVEALATEGARGKSRDRHAWIYLKEGLKGFSVKKRLEVVFYGHPKLINSLEHQYEVRNDAAHNYKKLPPEAADLSSLIREWEDLVEKF